MSDETKHIQVIEVPHCPCGANLSVLDNVCHGETVDSCYWCGRPIETVVHKQVVIEEKK